MTSECFSRRCVGMSLLIWDLIWDHTALRTVLAILSAIMFRIGHSEGNRIKNTICQFFPVRVDLTGKGSRTELLPLKVYAFTLSCMGTTPCFSSTFTKGDYFCDFLFLWTVYSFQNRVNP